MWGFHQMWYKFHIYIYWKSESVKFKLFYMEGSTLSNHAHYKRGWTIYNFHIIFFWIWQIPTVYATTLRIYYCVCIFFIGITWYYPASKVDTVWQFEHRYEFHADFYIVPILILFGYRPMWYILSHLFAVLSTAISRITSQFL